jgi:hypothetical protein
MARSNSFEGGSNGTTLTQGSGGNTGGSSGDFLDSVSVGTGATVAFSTAQAAHGSVSMNTVTTGTSALAYAGWTLASVASDFSRAYCRFATLPSAQQLFMRYLSSGSQSVRVNVTTAGLIEIRNAANTVVGTTTSAISANSWFRVELSVTFSATVGAVTLRLYLTPDSTTISDSLTLSSLALTATASELRFGIGAAMANTSSEFFDDIATEGATWHGPAVRTIAPTGIGVTAALGSPAVSQSLSVTPTGVAVPVSLGSTAVSQTFAVTPTGIAVPAALGSPSVDQSMSVAPAGVTVGLNLGSPSVAQVLSVIPDGIAVPVNLGTAAVGLAQSVTPDGIAVPVALGSPELGSTRVIHRPDTGTTVRPSSGLVVRPDTGVVSRP